MPKSDRLYVGHMLDAAEKIVERTVGVDRARFDADLDLRIVLTHLIQTFGEAARRVSPETRALYPAIPWREAVGMRHKIVHDYFEIDDNAVWNVATVQLPQLLPALANVLSPEGGLES